MINVFCTKINYVKHKYKYFKGWDALVHANSCTWEAEGGESL